jgi:hypothetical protein
MTLKLLRSNKKTRFMRYKYILNHSRKGFTIFILNIHVSFSYNTYFLIKTRINNIIFRI